MSSLRCAIYTRKSSEEGLEQDFNSLDAQREACGAYIQSQRHEGWTAISGTYDDGGFSGGNMNRPGLVKLLADIDQGKVDIVVVYKVDRLTRSLADFAKIVESFDKKGVSFVSVTQQFNTTTSMGRLTLNVLLSFAQFEREVTGERIRDKVAASKKKGMFMGGNIPVGYDLDNRKLVINKVDALFVRGLFEHYLAHGNVTRLKQDLDKQHIRSKVRTTKAGKTTGGFIYTRGMLYYILKNRIYLGEISHRGQVYPGEHQAIVDIETFDRVQAAMANNRRNHVSKARSKEPSLLTGLIYDQYGRRLTPRHTTKQGKRLRYYVSGPAQDLSQGDGPRPVRVSSHNIEQIVFERLQAILDSTQQLASILDKASAIITVQSMDIQQAKLTLAQQDHRALPLLKSLLHKVTVGQQDVTIQIDKASLARAIGLEIKQQPEDRLIHAITFKAAFRRIGSEMRLILDDAGLSLRKGEPDPALLKAIARAHRWVDQLQAGKATSIKEIAKAEGFNPRYVAHIMPLAYLAPDITESILGGNQPLTLNLDRLLKGFPADWAAQRQQLGFVA